MTKPAGHDHAGHDHAVSASADVRLLTLSAGLLAVFLVGELVTAIASGSLALLADAGHMLSDVSAVSAAIVAIRLGRRPARGAWTFGLRRAEILSAAANGVTLLIVSALVLLGAIEHLIRPPHVVALPVLVLALVGVAVNLAATAVLARANRSSLNVEGAFVHIVTDVFGFAATAVAGVVMLETRYERADALASLVVVALMLSAAWRLLRASGRVLLEGAPEGVDLDDVRSHMLGTSHVLDVHDLHAWTVTSDLPALSAHVVVEDSCFADGHAPRILDELQSCLVGHFDLEHSTFQLEPVSHLEHEPGTHG